MKLTIYSIFLSDICEDIELKERLLEMKNQLESKGLGKASALSRKHSQNTRRYERKITSFKRCIIVKHFSISVAGLSI